jgi:hypothetical protein
MNIESYLFIGLAKGASADLTESVGWSRRNMVTCKMPQFEIIAERPVSMTGSNNRVDLAALAAELVGSMS